MCRLPNLWLTAFRIHLLAVTMLLEVALPKHRSYDSKPRWPGMILSSPKMSLIRVFAMVKPP